MDKKSNHILIINSLRGIAALAVVFYHYICKTIDYVQNETVLSTFHYGHKGVQLFFIISGIVIPLSMINSEYSFKKFGTFIKKRFVRIEPPYLVAVGIGIFYLIIRNYIPGTVENDLTPSFTEILLHIGYLIPFFDDAEWVNPVFWTLAIEFQYYLALAVFFPLVLSKKISLRVVFYAVFVGMSFIPTTMAFLPYWGPYFMVGIAYVLYRKELIQGVEYWIVNTILATAIIYSLGFVDFGIAAVAILLIHFLPNLASKLTLFLGKISYSLYLLHAIIGAAFVNYLSHIYRTPIQQVIVISIGILISIASATIMYRFVEKPTHNYAKKIK